MSLHDKILNLPQHTGVYASGYAPHVAYKEGHRDARHAAAELVVAQDKIVAQLVEALERVCNHNTGSNLLERQQDWEQARAALAAAKEQQ